ncbi:hypothetical protein F5Y15DRAFT_291186 [Xylariaceae sp. FL0016]|nr:hypothetical protein F5Y15DRAFT_291186 [Xylariaceae sp. FL0016]
MFHDTTKYALALLAASQAVSAHTWVETLFKIDSTGGYTGDAGYPIGYIPREANVPDDQHQNKILDTKTNPAVCKPTSSSNYDKYPRLKAAAGDYVAMQYQENGHVTQPTLTPRPYRGGNVYVYGTSEHRDSDGINDVLNSWTADGKGGNGKGKLLATHFFDDDQCYQQVSGNAIADERKAKFGVDALDCQTDLQLPEDLTSDGTYTLIWVWDWPLIISDTQNSTEIYTSCAEVDVSGSKTESVKSLKYAHDNKVQSAGIKSQLHEVIEATELGVGTSSPPAPTGIATATATKGSDAPAETSATAPSSHKSHGGVKTVTVTAEPETVTQFTTVTVGAGSGNAQQTGATTTTTTTTGKATAPTSMVPVTSVGGFLRARVTGQARRDAASQ